MNDNDDEQPEPDETPPKVTGPFSKRIDEYRAETLETIAEQEDFKLLTRVSRARLLGVAVLDKIVIREDDPKHGIREDARSILQKLVTFHQKNEVYWRVRDVEEPDPYLLAASMLTPEEAKYLIENTIAEANLTAYEWEIKGQQPILKNLLTRSEYELFKTCISDACKDPDIKEHAEALLQTIKYPNPPKHVRNIVAGAAAGMGVYYFDSLDNGGAHADLMLVAGGAMGAYGYLMGNRVRTLKEDIAASATAIQIEDWVGEAAYDLLSTRSADRT